MRNGNICTYKNVDKQSIILLYNFCTNPNKPFV